MPCLPPRSRNTRRCPFPRRCPAIPPRSPSGWRGDPVFLPAVAEDSSALCPFLCLTPLLIAAPQFQCRQREIGDRRHETRLQERRIKGFHAAQVLLVAFLDE